MDPIKKKLFIKGRPTPHDSLLHIKWKEYQNLLEEMANHGPYRGRAEREYVYDKNGNPSIVTRVHIHREELFRPVLLKMTTLAKMFNIYIDLRSILFLMLEDEINIRIKKDRDANECITKLIKCMKGLLEEKNLTLRNLEVLESIYKDPNINIYDVTKRLFKSMSDVEIGWTAFSHNSPFEDYNHPWFKYVLKVAKIHGKFLGRVKEVDISDLYPWIFTIECNKSGDLPQVGSFVSELVWRGDNAFDLIKSKVVGYNFLMPDNGSSISTTIKLNSLRTIYTPIKEFISNETVKAKVVVLDSNGTGTLLPPAEYWDYIHESYRHIVDGIRNGTITKDRIFYNRD
jgi:hypothetical protein